MIENLEYLDLSFNEIYDDDIAFFPREFPRLKTLILDQNAMVHFGIHHLSQISFPSLETLSISDNELEDASIYFFDPVNAPILKRVNLSFNRISYLGYSQIKKIANLKKIEFEMKLNNIEHPCKTICLVVFFTLSISMLTLQGFLSFASQLEMSKVYSL